MFAGSLLTGYSERQLRMLLSILFLALAIPTAALSWQAYRQLKWEAWYQYRGQAEELTARIDTALRQRIAVAESRHFRDFAFLNDVAGSKLVERSPLSVLPLPQDVPGVIGYFQVDPDGHFSTPLLPDAPVQAGEAGLSDEDVSQRQALSDELRQILADNLLVGERPPAAGRALPATLEERESEQADRVVTDRASDFRESAAKSTADANVPVIPAESAAEELQAQAGFDQLNQIAEPARAARFEVTQQQSVEAGESSPGPPTLGKLQDLRLDEALQKKNEDRERQEAGFGEQKDMVESDIASAPRAQQPSADVAVASAAIRTFDSEIDPYQFSLLRSGHLVLYRNVWHDGNRYIQGLLIDQAGFTAETVESAFKATTLSAMSDLVIAYQDDVIDVIRGGHYERAFVSAGELDGALLYRNRLSAPFDSLELVFSISRLPPGPGASVLAWTTLVIVLVFVGGFFALYRLGIGQIRLARQQQDFVSAVSHELKTPLTSIRMYGEMLREGWADETKRKQYYEYIHDESERLTRLISNVLQLARLTRNEPHMDLRPVSVAELMDRVRSRIDNQAQRAGFELRFLRDENADQRVLNIDADHFTQIIINLVDNAIKFSRQAATKRVEISSHAGAEGRVHFTVRDYGPGIPKSQLKKIFRLFYRAESELTRETVGTGIGLAIVRQLTHAMSGQIDVVNRDPGAEFRLSFSSIPG